MKKMLYVIIFFSSLVMLTACSSPKFNGSSTGNDNQFIMEYRILNTSDYRKMSLKSGDIIDAKVVSKSGSVSVEVKSSDGEVIYVGENIPTTNFDFEIPQDDTYTFTVTGHNAKGSVSFVKRQ